MKEFFSDPNSGEPMFREVSETLVKPITENDTELIAEILEHSKTFYPEQYAALSKVYAKSSSNPSYYQFLMARRIVSCCVGTNHQPVTHEGRRVYEPVACPIKAECKYHKIICEPKFNNELSERELEVMKLYFLHVGTDEIAERLYLSIHTIRNHRRNALQKLNLRSLLEFQDYAHRNNLFKN